MNLFINFNKGLCRKAVTFYADVFGLKVPEFSTFGEMPEDPEHTMTEETKKLIMFTSLTIDDTLIMFSDCPPEMPLVMGNNISLTLVNTDENYLKKIFDALKQGGQITMPLQKTFWSPLYGMLTDQFGISWQFSQDEV